MEILARLIFILFMTAILHTSFTLYDQLGIRRRIRRLEHRVNTATASAPGLSQVRYYLNEAKRKLAAESRYYPTSVGPWLSVAFGSELMNNIDGN